MMLLKKPLVAAVFACFIGMSSFAQISLKQQPAAGVLLVGGEGEDGVNSQSLVYDFINKSMVYPPSPKYARYGHTATLLKDGRILVVGGLTKLVFTGPAPVTATAEIYDPSAQTWSVTGSLNTGRAFHTATRLPDGKVLITGGTAAQGGTLNSAELYDPATGKFAPAGSMLQTRSYHYAVLLPNSTKVLIYGGVSVTGGANVFTRTAEIWDESTGSFAAAGQSPSSIWSPETPDAARLEGSERDIVGGISQTGEPEADETVLTLDNPPSFATSAKKLNQARASHTLTALANNELLVTGGISGTGGAQAMTALLNDASPLLTAGLSAPNAAQALTALLNSPRLLVKAALSGTFATTVLQDAEIRDGNGWTLLPAKMLSPRFLHSATLLPDGTVFIAGGLDGDFNLTDTTELYDPTTKSFMDGPAGIPIAAHTATLFSTTVTTLFANPLNAIPDQSVTLSAQVTSAAGTPTGKVQFLDGSAVIATVDLSAGNASTDHKFTVGSHTLTAVYSGDDINSESTSDPVTVNVAAAKVGTSTSVKGNPNPATINSDVIFTVSVTPASGSKIPTGSVILKDGDSPLATLSLDKGSASFRTSSLSAGKHSITATYEGDSSFEGSTSPALTEEVNGVSTPVVGLKSDPNPSKAGQTVTFIVTVSPANANDPTPKGNVQISEPLPNGSNPTYGSCNLDNKGACQISVDNLTAGKHGIVATYGGDPGVYNGAASQMLYQEVDADTAQK